MLNSKVANEVKLFSGMKKIIQAYSEKYKLAIVSSNSKENIELFLKRNKILGFFELIYSDSSIFGKAKVIKHMCQKNNIHPEEIIYIGDEDRDVAACKKLKITVIAVTWGYNSKNHLMKSKPDFLVETPEQLLKAAL